MPTRILVVDDSPTIRTVVSTILERHGYDPKVASDGQDAYEALASGEVEADLVLLDFVMPHMNGYQFCQALRDNADLAETPVVLMSAKADRIRDQFVEQTGALDAITKPFDAQALVAVIENALRRVNAASRARWPDDEAETGEGVALGVPDLRDRSSRAVLDDPDATGRFVPSPSVELETQRTHVAQMVAQKLAGIAARALAQRSDVVGSDPPDVAALTRAIAERLSPEAVLEMGEVIGDVSRGRGRLLLSGDLGAVPIGAILQLLQAENQTGVLVCTNGVAEVRTTFRGGYIDLVEASGAGDEFRLGRFFVEEGAVTPEEIDAIAQRRIPDDDPPSSSVHPAGGRTGTLELEVPGARARASARRPLGMALLAAGKIVESQLRAALTKQSCELLYEVLRWPSGRFELRREPPSELADGARLGLPVASVVMEGFRRVDEWRVLERTLGSFDAVLIRDHAASAKLDVAALPAKERAVLAAVDGERTVRAIVAASHLSSFDACRILVQLLEARALRRRVA